MFIPIQTIFMAAGFYNKSKKKNLKKLTLFLKKIEKYDIIIDSKKK